MAKQAAIQLAPDLWRIPTMGDMINSFAFVEDDGSVTLVDCGIEKAPPKIVAGLAAMGKHPKDVNRILLTHVHPDHAGGAAEMARQTGAPVQVHRADAPSAEAGQVLERPDPKFMLGRIFSRLNPGRFPAIELGEPLTEGVMPIAGGLRVIHTPGHSAGHVSLLHEPSDVLVTGDALFNFLGRSLRWSPKFLCADFRMTQQTAQVFSELDYRTAAFTHGPEITDGAREKIRAFLRDNT